MITLIVATALSLLVVAIAAGAARGRLRLNGLVGIRTRQTMKSEGAWKAGHAAALPFNVATAIATIGVSVIVCLATPEDDRETWGLLATAVFIAGLIVSAFAASAGAKEKTM